MGEESPAQVAAARVPPRPGWAERAGAAVPLGPVSPRTWRAVVSLLVSLVIGTLFCTVLILALTVSAALSWIVGLGMIVMSFTLRLSARMAGAVELGDRRGARGLRGRH